MTMGFENRKRATQAAVTLITADRVDRPMLLAEIEFEGVDTGLILLDVLSMFTAVIRAVDEKVPGFSADLLPRVALLIEAMRP